MLPALCIGHRVELTRSQAGCVHSCFEGAVNLLIEGNLWSLLDAARADLPCGVRLAARTAPGRLALRVGQPVQVKAGYLGVEAVEKPKSTKQNPPAICHNFTAE